MSISKYGERGEEVAQWFVEEILMSRDLPSPACTCMKHFLGMYV